jgi:hypothetical protein
MHLAGCEICAAHLEEFSGMEPMLAMLAEAPVPPSQYSNVLNMPGMYAAPGLDHPPPRPVPVVPKAPSPQLLGGLLDEVAAKRAIKRRRGMYLVAAAAALIIGSPAATVVATSNGAGSNQAVQPSPTSSADGVPFSGMDEKVEAIDPTTKVSAAVGMAKKAWGTHTVLELKNVKGPLKCNLIAVSKDGEQEVVTSWAVPAWGYGIPDSPNEMGRKPLYVQGGAAMNRNDIDHFEVRTFEGKRLVEVAA